MEEIGKKKIKGAIIVSAGFKEVDDQGRKLEEEVGAIGEKVWHKDHRSKLSWNHELI
jgi:acyl-CoA synthetase (NDP forming)